MTQASKFNKKIETLQTVAGSLLEEIKSLKFAMDFEDEDNIDFYEKVGKFETHLIEKPSKKQTEIKRKQRVF